MRWFFSFGWLHRVLHKRRQQQPSRRWVKQIRPLLEPLEERRLFNVNVWLPQRLDPLDGTTQTNPAVPLFLPANSNLLPDLSLQSTAVSATGLISLTDSGVYNLTLTQSGPAGSGNRYTFSESGPVSFSLVELGNLSATGFSITSVVLTQNANLSWAFLETNSGGATLESLSGANLITVVSNGAAPFDAFFPAGLNWLSLTQQIDSVNSLGLYSLSADSVSVNETAGSETYVLQKTSGLATITGNVRQPLSSVLDQSGQTSYSETAVEQFGSTESGSDSFSLLELGSYANSSYALGSVAYQETGTQGWQFNATVTDSQSGTGSSTGVQSFSGSNHTLNGSSSQSYQFSSLATTSYGESATGNYSLSQSGSFGANSFNLSSLSDSVNGSGGYSLTQNALQTQTGSFTSSNNAAGTDSFGVSGTMIDSGTATQGGNYTSTQSSTLMDNESGLFTSSAAGGYGNASWALASFNLSESLSGTFSQQQLGTTTQTGNSTTTDTGGGTDSFLLNRGALNTTSGGGSRTSTDTSTDSFTQISTSSSTLGGPSSMSLSELGASAGGSVSLSSFVFTSAQSGLSTATGNANETDTGGGQDTTSGSGSATECASLGSASIQITGNSGFSGSDSFSFTSTDSSTSSDNGTFSQTAYSAGLYNNASWALSSVALSSDTSDTWSDTSTDSSTDSGTSASSDNSGGKNTSTAQFGLASVVAGAGNSYSESDSGTFLDTSFATTTDAGFSQSTLTQQGSYGHFSYSFGQVNSQSTDSSTQTTQLAASDNTTDTVSDSSSGNSNQSVTNRLANSTDTGSSNATNSGGENIKQISVDTVTETLTGTDSTTEYQSGSFLGGLWNLSNVSVSESSTDSFTEQDLMSSTDSGTDSFSSSLSGTSGATNVLSGGSATGSANAHSSVNGSDSFTAHINDTIINSGVDTYSLTEQGIFANYSFAFFSVVSQGGDIVTSSDVESASETSVGVQTASFGGGGQQTGVGTYGFGGDSNSASDNASGSDSFATGDTGSWSETVSSSQNDGYYEAGQFSGDSLSLAVVSVQESGSDTWSVQSSDTSTDSGTFNENGNGSAGGQMRLGSLVCLTGPTDSSGNSFSAFDMVSGNASDTSFHSTTDSGSDSWSLSELGSYGNFSFAYSSVVSSDGGSDNEIVSDSSTDSYSGSFSNNNSSGDSQSASGVSGYDSFNAHSGNSGGSSDSMIVTDYGQSQATVNTSSTWSDYQAGSFSGDSWALSSVSDSSGGSDTWTEQSNDTASASGAQTINGGLSFGNGGTVSGYSGLTVSVGGSASSSETFGGTDTRVSTTSANSSGTDSWNQSQSGTYGNFSFAFTNVVEQSGGSSSGCLTESSVDTFAGARKSGDSVSAQENGSDNVGGVNGNGNAMSSVGDSMTETVQLASTSTVSSGDSSSWSEYQSGSYAGGSYAFASVNDNSGGADSSTDIVSSTWLGTFTGTGSNSDSANGGWLGSVAASNTAMLMGSGSDSFSGTDSGTSNTTIQSGDCWSVSEQGSYANGSYNLSNYVSSSSDSNSVNAQQTDSMQETVTSTGNLSDSGGASDTASVQGTWTSTGSPTMSGSFSLGLNVGASNSDSGSFTETMNVTETTTDTEADTFSEAQSQSGVYAAGSFNLSSVTSSQSSSSSLTAQSEDTYTSTDTRHVYSSSGGNQNGYNSDGYRVNGNESAAVQDTVTGGDTQTEQSQSSGALAESGSYSNSSYSVSSYALSDSGSDTITSSSSDTFTSSSAGTTSGTESVDMWTAYNGSGSFTRGGNGSASSAGTQTDNWSLAEQGGSGGGSFALSCFGFSLQQSNSELSSDGSSWSETFAGTDASQTYSGSDTGSNSDTQGSSSSGSLVELGSTSGGSLSLSVLSYSGSGSESSSATDSESGSWSGSYSGSDSSSATQAVSGNYSVSALGSFSNGSVSLSSYVLTGGSTGTQSQGASESDTLQTPPLIGTVVNVQNFGRSDTAVGLDSNQVYQSGVETAGSYANVSYSLTDGSSASVMEGTSAPSYSSSDSWQSSDTLAVTLSGASATSSATLSFRNTNDSGSGSTYVVSSPSVSVPGLLVNLSAPDAGSVPVEGGDESSGWMQVSQPSVAWVPALGAWMKAVAASACQATQPDGGMAPAVPASAGAPTQPAATRELCSAPEGGGGSGGGSLAGFASVLGTAGAGLLPSGNASGVLNALKNLEEPLKTLGQCLLEGQKNSFSWPWGVETVLMVGPEGSLYLSEEEMQQWKQWNEEINQTLMGLISKDGPRDPNSVGQPGFGESFIPVWGSGRSAIDHFQNGEYLSGGVQTIFTVADLFLVDELVTGGIKLGGKLLARGAAEGAAEELAAGGGKVLAKDAVENGIRAAPGKVGKLLGHNEYAVGDAAKAARTKQSLLDYYKKNAKNPSITPVEGMAGAEINTVTGEIRIGKEVLENYPHLADGYLVEELRHFQALHQQKMLGRALTAAEEAALEKDIVDFMARPESGFKVFDPRKR